jgi:solute carrier family 9B (sodium/hydrogen exchanger), member 1/2
MAENLLALALLLGTSVVAGRIAGRIGLPPLVGMLAAGIALRNLAGFVIERIPDDWSLSLRLFALTVILLRAGLGLNLAALRRLRGAFLRLSFLPNLAETAMVALAASVLFDLPADWAILLGFVVAAVSPAVVVPGLLDLQQKGYGVSKGIPTMVLAAASFDDVVAITGFGFAVSLVFAGEGDPGLAATLARAPLELGFGLGIGIITGLACGSLRRAPIAVRFWALTLGGLAAVFGGWAVDLTGGGSLAAVTMGAVAAHRWHGGAAPVAQGMARVWSVAEPVLFVLIGAAVALSTIEPTYVTSGLVILATGLAVRAAVTYGSVANREFTRGERLFVTVAWVPKATVQAALGALALDMARETPASTQLEIYGTQVLTVAVLAILVTAPIGAIAIARLGPRWLDRHQTPPNHE